MRRSSEVRFPPFHSDVAHSHDGPFKIWDSPPFSIEEQPFTLSCKPGTFSIMMSATPVSPWRKKTYTALVLVASVMAIFVLVVTNTTMPLNADIHAMSRQIRELKDENRLLEMQIFEETCLELVDKNAMAQGMLQPQEIIFFHVHKGYDAF